ncbi:MAG: cyclopropane-fatty-acyl-phospholipid synthase family protein [Proteobacteria bacterium]|jgi:cyclopropane-fatty-acyl-phospholipid synthase|nr:cyclopropane-fatty-acyl-phospholipid synthase family protein [Pseudomonadota bacterium]
MFDNYLRKQLIMSLNKVKYGTLQITLPDGVTMQFMGDLPGGVADIHLSDWRVVANATIKGDVGFAADYRDGFWSTSNLEMLIRFGMENDKLFSHYGNGNIIFKQFSKLLYLTKRNSLKGSQKNIQQHYDLGNDFYQLWLDKSMTYSSAIFRDNCQDLTLAQYHKYERLLAKIDKPNAKILEIGCGWGGFAERALLKGHSLKGITLSNEQATYAQKRLGECNAEIVIEDYRVQSGTYDYIVSIEMFEAVGIRFWPVYFNKLKQLLKPGGKILLQTITIADDIFNHYTKNADMIRTFIFPGGMLPCEKELGRQFKQNGLVCKDVYRFGGDYSSTLQRWLHSFDNAYNQIKNLGFDDGFIRLWRFYLAASSAGFALGRINVIQFELEHATMA